jgi:hypothetical protein
VPASAGVPATTAQDNSAIYFTTGSAVSGAVYRIALDAGGVPQALASNQDGPGALLLTDAGVYWTNYFGGEVMHTGAAGTPEVVAGGQLRPRQLTSDDDRLYWVNEAPTEATVPSWRYLWRAVRRCAFPTMHREALRQRSISSLRPLPRLRGW